ncbi:hypothetical protein SAMN04244573_03234 [Azotobacter beijerinckii]|uniref:Uncharacterized protein n=1 Tax=Azotobacter beijerinckii TaxID=170623 RepID=A0A1H9MRP6_9GAMM|nr:hypothetical protein [Azotobacter beijerinckii]SER26085.1 hypothetical protein SAMN04244573_03234 [Azotobacter beijerinckii]
MKIDLPSIAEQQAWIFEEATKEAITQLKTNLQAPRIAPQTELDESAYSRAHLLREREGWEAPHQDIVAAYFRHFQKHFPEYNTDKKLAALLGLSGDRRVREFKEGSRKVPYGVWRAFLVMTGRAPQDVLPVLAYMA